jgi:hypothetical protein
MKSKYRFLAPALRAYAKRLLDEPDNVDIEEARALDRALRTCPGIGDIDVVWPRWAYIGEKRGWFTDKEMKTNKSGWYYPNSIGAEDGTNES